MDTPDDTDTRALTAPYTGRDGVLNRANSALAVRWMREHWGKPANIAQSLAAIARAEAQLAHERVQRSHEQMRERRKKEREKRVEEANAQDAQAARRALGM